MDYNEMVKKIVEATEPITDDKLKEIAFSKLLDKSLGNSPSPDNTSIQSSKSAGPATAGRQRGKKRRATTSTVKENTIRQEVKDAFSDANPNVDGYKPLGSIKKNWEKYIWVLVVAKDKNIDAMTNAEIAYVLTDKFSVGATEKTVNNLTFKVEAGFVQKRDLNGNRAWKVLVDGINAVRAEDSNGAAS